MYDHAIDHHQPRVGPVAVRDAVEELVGLRSHHRIPDDQVRRLTDRHPTARQAVYTGGVSGRHADQLRDRYIGEVAEQLDGAQYRTRHHPGAAGQVGTENHPAELIALRGAAQYVRGDLQVADEDQLQRGAAPVDQPVHRLARRWGGASVDVPGDVRVDRAQRVHNGLGVPGHRPVAGVRHYQQTHLGRPAPVRLRLAQPGHRPLELQQPDAVGHQVDEVVAGEAILGEDRTGVALHSGGGMRSPYLVHRYRQRRRAARIARSSRIAARSAVAGRGRLAGL